MEKNEFIRQLSRLQKIYGRHTYPPDCCVIIYNEFKGVSANFFRRMVDEALGDNPDPNKYPPGIKKLRLIAVEVRKGDLHLEKEERENETVNLGKTKTAEETSEELKGLGQILNEATLC